VVKRDHLDKEILLSRSELSKTCPAILVQSFCGKIQEVNSKIFNHFHQMKAQKLQQIIALRSQITSESSLESLNTVVSTPEHLPLSNLEKSVLSKGLEFVATCVSKKLDEFSVKQEVEKFYRRAVN